MKRNLRCIVLRSVRFNDTHSIVNAYSLEAGRVSFLTPSGSSREALRRKALMMPMSIVECNVDFVPGKDLLSIRDVSRPGGFEFSDNPLKSVLALFLADFLNTTLREQQPDEALFRYLEEALRRLGEVSGTALANFHIAFMVGLQRYLGIEPDFSTYKRGRVFDLIDGVFRASAPLHGRYLNREEAAEAFLLGRITLRNMGFYRFNREQRNRVVDVILDFYSLHLGNLRDLQSLEVVRSLF